MAERRPSVFAPLEGTFEYVQTALFREFNGKKWLIWGFLAFLGSNLAHGVGFSFPMHSGGGSGEGGGPDWSEVRGWVVAHWQLLAAIGGALIVVGLAVFLAWVYLTSRGRFMFLECLVEDKVEIAESWRNNGRPALSLFTWQLGYTAFFLLFLALTLISGFLILFKNGQFQPLRATWPELLMLAAGFVLVLIPMMAVTIYLEDFVVLLMWHRRLPVLAAWSLFLDHFRSHSGPFLLYLPCRIMLNIAAGSILFLGTCLTCCIGST